MLTTFSQTLCTCTKVDLQNILIRHLSLRNSKSPRFPSATVLGVVIGFSLPTRVKTGQWMITISIVDPTLPIDESGEGLHVVNCNIFRRKVEDLPTVRRAGDLVRMEEAGVQVSCFLERVLYCKDTVRVMMTMTMMPLIFVILRSIAVICSSSEEPLQRSLFSVGTNRHRS